MKNGFTKNQFSRLSSITAFVAVLSVVLVSSGCRQPVSNNQASRPNTFPSLWGGGQGFGNNTSQQSYLGSNRQPGAGFGQGQGGLNSGVQDQQYAQINSQLQGMNQRLNAYDSDNQLLNTEVASLQQKLQLANQYSQSLKDQLADTSGRIQQSEMAKQAALQRLASVQMQLNQNQGSGNQLPAQQAGFNGNSAPTGFSNATIRANNSLMQRFSNIRIPGGQARMDGDVIRIEFPTDRLFVQGTYQIQPAQQPLLQNIVGTIRQNFPRQIVGIEAHWDNTPLNPSTTTHHQLTATQALAVFDQMVRLGLPRNQMFTMAMASNRPRHPQGVSGGVSPNRRIELVIYPETYDGT